MCLSKIINSEHITTSVSETEHFGAEIAFFAVANGIKTVALYGGLGAGKTAFVRGFCSGLGCDAEVSSPTYSYMNEYKCEEIDVYHFDMYKVKTIEDVHSVGFFDYLNAGGIMVIEWSENVDGFLTEETLKILINVGKNENERIIIVK